ncbi:MAG: hypothetical protein WDZ74_00190 [Candidatus Paceibacterota bacterium]
MNKYKDSFETRSKSLEQGGKGIMTAVTNEDISAPPIKPSNSTPRAGSSKTLSKISPIRTLAEDLEQSVKDNHVTLSQQVLTKEGGRVGIPSPERGPEVNQRTRKHRKDMRRGKKRIPRSFVFLFFTLIIFGISLYLFTSRQGIELSAPNVPGLGSYFSEEVLEDSLSPTHLIRADETRELVLTPKTGRAELRRFLNEESRARETGILTALKIRNEIETESGVETESADITSLLNIIEPSVQSVLSRNINEYTLGVSGGGEAQAFLVAKITSYEEIFGALLTWERRMPRELYGFFHSDIHAATRDDTASFSDSIVAGIDARVLTKVQQTMNKEGVLVESEEDLLIYSLINKEILIITHSREELARIISRLQ